MPNGVINLESALYQSNDEREKRIEIRNQLLEMQNTYAWKQVMEVVAIKQKRLKLQKEKSDNPDEVMSCDKQLQGIDFVLNAISGLVEDGETAILEEGAVD